MTASVVERCAGVFPSGTSPSARSGRSPRLRPLHPRLSIPRGRIEASARHLRGRGPDREQLQAVGSEGLDVGLHVGAALVLAAGLEGISQNMDPGEPHTENMYLKSEEELCAAPTTT